MTDVPPDTGPIVYHRAFLALMPCDETKKLLRQALSQRTEMDEGQRVQSDDWHLTLAFIGDITERGRQNFTGLIQSIKLVETPPIVTLNKLGAFPPVSRSVCAAAFADNDHKLDNWQASIKQGVKSLLYKQNTDSFIPHVTLARGRPTSRWEVEMLNIPFIAQSVSLMAKAQAASQFKYQTLATLPLIDK